MTSFDRHCNRAEDQGQSSSPLRGRHDFDGIAFFPSFIHMDEFCTIYMYSGACVTVKFAADASLMDALVDWYGKSFRIKEEGDGKMLVTLKCNEEAMKYWALQYGDCIEIMEPERLRATVREVVERMAKKYADCPASPVQSF